MAAVTIRDVPSAVRDALADEAKSRGQSLQAFLLGLLTQRADFSHNRQLLIEIDEDFARRGGGAGADAPSPGDLIRAARRESGRE